MGLRARFVFLLMVYAAGFLTAVYVMAPTENGDQKGFTFGKCEGLRDALQPNQFAHSVNTGLSKCADMSKAIAGHASAIIKEQLNERRKNNDKNES